LTGVSILFQPCLFFLSFLPLWVSVTFIDIMGMIETDVCLWTEKISLACVGIGTVISLLVVASQIKKRRDGSRIRPSLRKAVKQKAVTAEYLLSYILPLFAFDFTKWKQVVLFLIFFTVLAYLCLKHHYVYANIVLEVRGYTCYDCTLVKEEGETFDAVFDAVVISRQELSGMLNCPIDYANLGGGYGLDITKPNV